MSAPWRHHPKLRISGGLLVVFFLMAGCAGWHPPTMTASQCGNPCATMVCPSAFRCDVDQGCHASCAPQPEGMTLR
jgi:hypothetical protein